MTYTQLSCTPLNYYVVNKVKLYVANFINAGLTMDQITKTIESELDSYVISARDTRCFCTVEVTMLSCYRPDQFGQIVEKIKDVLLDKVIESQSEEIKEDLK